MVKRFVAAAAAILLTSPAFCQTPASPPAIPAGARAQRVSQGIFRYETVIPRNGNRSRIWVYLPERLATPKVPCVVIAPAGSHLFDGMLLGDGDMAEQLPWVRAGFAVVSYEIDGYYDPKSGDAGIPPAIRAFMAARGGLENARTAINYVAQFSAVDADRIFVAGHSSAATLALLIAETDSRVKGCAAFAPIVDVPNTLKGEGILDPLNQMVPGFKEFVQTYSPHAGVATLKCPLLLFQAEDDHFPIAATAAFADSVKKTNANVTFVRVPVGGHYEPMIKQGIPLAIEWVKQLKTESAAR